MRHVSLSQQQDGRLTLTELVERIQLSVSPCHPHAALERTGVISGYHARPDAHAPDDPTCESVPTRSSRRFRQELE